MASIKKRDGAWVAQVAKRGVRRSKSFATKAKAEVWAARLEEEIDARVEGRLPADKSFGELLERYRDEVSVHKRGARWEHVRINMILRETKLADVRLTALDTPDVVAWRDKRLKQVSAASVRREWALLSHACQLAVKEWKWMRSNPFKDVAKPASVQPRARRISEKELEQLLHAAGYARDERPATATARVGAALLFAIETGMRAGEITSLRWGDVNTNHVHLPMTKNGWSRDVPLSEEAKRLIEQVRGIDDVLVFALNSSQLDALFRKVKKRALIEDLHFHDSRREALTRMAKKLNVMELARVSGHRDLRILQSVYYAPSVDDIAAKL